MGYVFVVGTCYFCHVMMTFNPVRVPSVMVKGTREPFCLACHKKANEIRKAHNLEPWPEPFPDAYEAVDENEVW